MEYLFVQKSGTQEKPQSQKFLAIGDTSPIRLVTALSTNLRRPSFISKCKRHRKRGQTMMEYILIVALLAVASIPVVKVLGDVFRDRVMSSADAMMDNKSNYKSQGEKYVGQGSKKVERDMINFSDTKK